MSRVEGRAIQPTGAAGFQEIESADDVRLDKIAGTGDGTIHMRFGCQMHDVRDAMLLDNLKDCALLPQIRFLENILWMSIEASEVFQMSGIGQAIKVNKPGNLRFLKDVPNQVRADEAGAPGNQQIHC